MRDTVETMTCYYLWNDLLQDVYISLLSYLFTAEEGRILTWKQLKLNVINWKLNYELHCILPR